MADSTAPCRCLLAEADADLGRLVADYIASLPTEAKADDHTRQSRLALCLACPHLLNGTCRLCGCYAEARAAKVKQRCPDIPPQW